MWRSFMELLARGVERELRDSLSASRAAAITGPRQAGKSTLARQLQDAGVVPNYFSLDDEATRIAALSDPDGFVLSLPRPAAIDEVQRARISCSPSSRSSIRISAPASSC